MSIRPFLAALLSMSAFSAFSAPTRAQTFPINECGTLVQAVTCVMFQADSGGLYILNFGSFQVGDYVHVNGVVDQGCISICQQGNGCISQSTITLCGPGQMYCATPGFPQLPTPCPCNNFGDYAHGCANSQNASGALLVATGTTSPDTIVLSASKMLTTSLCIFIQGDASISNGVVFGDGVRCIGGQLLRLGVKNAANGAAQYPELGDPSITQRCVQLGAPINPGDQREYQTYYRDPDMAFCPDPPGNTFNITNALHLSW